MRMSSFEKLKDLLGDEIEFEIKDISPIYKKFKFAKDKNLAEMVGVILGDGHIAKNDQEVKISLNPMKEPEYVNHVLRLFEKTLHVKPGQYSPPDKEEDIKIYSGRKGISKELQNLGLIPGNKVENQVDVPNWIKENTEFTKSCIKGLFDTDGSTYFQERKNLGIKYIQNKFSNKSLPLLDFFENFCVANNIKTSRTGDDVLIQSRMGVTAFFDIVKPQKMKYFLDRNKLRKEDLGRSLPID
jgi:intein/homing endonuclease